MPKKGHTEEQIVAALQRVEGGEKVGDCLPELGDQRSDLLRLEKAVCRPGSDGAARVAAVAGRERTTETPGRRLVPGSADPAGDCVKKAVRSRLRRRLAEWAQLVYRISERRAARLTRMVRSSQRYRSRRDPQLALRGNQLPVGAKPRVFDTDSNVLIGLSHPVACGSRLGSPFRTPVDC